MEAFKINYVVVRKNPPDKAGPVYSYRSEPRKAVIVANGPAEFHAILAENLKLNEGQEVEVAEWERLAAGVSVFQKKAAA